MMRSRHFTPVLLGLAVLLSGCVATELRVTNRTGGSIQFYTGHTKKAVQIQNGATAVVPHTSGRVIIISQQDEVWEYEAVNIKGDLWADARKSYKRVTLEVSVGAGGRITVPSGRIIDPTQTLSPKE